MAEKTPNALSHAEAAELFAPLLEGSDGVLVGVSGGPDSMALLALLAEWGKIRLAAATVDHGLRPEAASEARSVKAFCQQLGVEHHILPWLGEKPVSGLQAAARSARYALLVKHAHHGGFSHLATAHHADDQAETVLMRLVSGSGIAGLAAMRNRLERQGIVHIRPLLAISKERLVLTCVLRNIPFVDDASNSNRQFGRVRIRQVLDTLAAEGLTPERLGRLAIRAGQANDALDQITAAFFQSNAEPHWSAIAEQPKEIRLRILAQILRSETAMHKPMKIAEPVKLERLEALLAALDAAHADGKHLRRSLGAVIVTLERNGHLKIAAAPLRKRGLTPPRLRHET
ncbi:MAG: tRNA lysidine(34) synthetase TilS [Beijerinckiaceae bacterium]